MGGGRPGEGWEVKMGGEGVARELEEEGSERNKR